MASGIFAIYFSFKSQIYTACLFIILGIISDGVDGWVARLINKESAFGKAFDAIADFISFGLAPMAIYINYIKDNEIMSYCICACYLAASVFRLFRFYSSQAKYFFEGLPITAAAAILIFFLLVNRAYYEGTPILQIAAFIVSMLMISRVRCRRIF